MKRITHFITITILTLLLSGCGDGGIMSVTKLPVSDETIMDLGGQITDTSVQKEALHYKAVQHRDTQYAKLYLQSGTKLKFKMEEVAPGVHVQVLDEFTSREAPKFQQNMPDGPSVHPFWRTVDNIVDKGTDTLIKYTGITALADFGKQSLDKTVVRPEVVRPEVVRPEVIQVPQ